MAVRYNFSENVGTSADYLLGKNYTGPKIDMEDLILTATHTLEDPRAFPPGEAPDNGNQSTSDGDLPEKSKHV